MRAPHYLRWLSILCIVMAAFGVGVFVVGYQPPSFGRVATVVCLAIAAVVLRFVAHSLESRP